MTSLSLNVPLTGRRCGAAVMILMTTLACDSVGPEPKPVPLTPAQPTQPTPPPEPEVPEIPEAPILRGQIVFSNPFQGGLVVADSDGAMRRLLSVTPSYDREPAVSPDGKKIAFSSHASNEDGGDIWVMNANGTNRLRLTHTASGNSPRRWNSSPAWSPDGERIAFVTSRGGVSEHRIFVMNADGSDIKQITDDDMDSLAPEWSSDGSRILFSRPSGHSKDVGIFEMNSDGSDVRQLSSRSVVALTRSPDGAHIAFTDGGSLFVMSADGSNVRALTSDVYREYADITWSPDGNSIVFGIASTPVIPTPVICYGDWSDEFVCGYDQDLRRIGLDGVIVPNWKISSAASPMWQR